jgi:hypothetical protein
MICDNKKEFPCFNSFYSFLSHQFKDKVMEEKVRTENFDIENLLQVLAPYARGGKYDYC